MQQSCQFVIDGSLRWYCCFVQLPARAALMGCSFPCLQPCSWSSPYDTKLVPMRFEKTKAGTGSQKQQLGKMGALKAKKASCFMLVQCGVPVCCMPAALRAVLWCGWHRREA